MSKRVSVDIAKVGTMMITGMIGGAIAGAKNGAHIGIVYGRSAGVKGTVVFGTLCALTGAVGGAAIGTVASIKRA
jgi:phage tail tape-measure protein